MNKSIYLILLFSITACSGFKEKAGLVKYQPDEYQVITNPSLTVPPDFNVYSPEELIAKKNNPSPKDNSNLSAGESIILQNIKQ